ncbi:MAG: hypothetical protein CMB84_05460 [Flammeovirgaceae bacterium]|nr:hypothetical protein [Flammeovirgaceae bacterium]
MSIYISNYLNKLEKDLENKILKGNDILELTTSKQLNLFILKNIYDNWISNFEKNKSNFFDYESDDILDKVNSLQNTLSNHIHIKFEDLRILVKKSIIDLVKYMYDAKVFIKNDLNNDKILSNLNLDRRSKFYIENKGVFKSLIEKVQNETLKSNDIRITIDTFSFEKNQKLIDELRSILECEEKDLKTFYIDPIKYEGLFDLSEGELQDIINIAKGKKSFMDAAEFILEKLGKREVILDDKENIKTLLIEIKKNFI